MVILMCGSKEWEVWDVESCGENYGENCGELWGIMITGEDYGKVESEMSEIIWKEWNNTK